MSIRTLLVSSLLLGSAGIGVAQPLSGLYIGAGAGVNLSQTAVSANGHTHISTDAGPVGVAALGWGFGNGLRAELEGSYRSNEVSRLQTVRDNGLLEDTGNVQGRIGTAAAMANLLYDIDLTRFAIPVTPYIGAGIGYGWRDYDDVSGEEPLALTLPGNNVARGNGVTTRMGTYGHLAFQAIGGVAVPLSFLPGAQLTAEYRFFVMEHTRFGAEDILHTTNSFNGSVPSTRGYGYDDYRSHSVLIGLRYAFSSAPPPIAQAAPPVAPIAASRTYLVFFDWDRADLTDRARQIIGEAAQATTRVQVTRIEVDGYTDLSGSAAYNQGLSVRRAQAVAAELARDGVPRAAIAVQGFGESDPLVPTAAGVREPQNRRVQIILR